MNLLLKGCLIAGVSLIAIGSAITAFDYVRTLRRAQSSPAAVLSEPDAPEMTGPARTADRPPAEAAAPGGSLLLPEQLSGLTGLRLQLSGGNLQLRTGDQPGLWVGEKLLPYIRCEREEGTLVLEDTLGEKWSKRVEIQDSRYSVVLTLPDQEYTTAEISLGIGGGDIQNLSADTLSVNAGAGEMALSGLSARRLAIHCGAGECTARDLCAGEGAEIHCGIGECDLAGDLRGQVEVSGGIGAVKLLLAGKEEEYSICAEAGIGSVQVGEKTVSIFSGGLDERRKNAENSLDISCGVGEITIRFSEDMNKSF